MRSFRPTSSRRRAPTAASSPSSTGSSPAPGAAAPRCTAAARSARPSPNTAISCRSRRAQFFAAGIVATNAWTRKLHGKDFDRLAAKERDDALKALEQGKAELGDFDGKPFFEALLHITMEGFFADPIYGGNRNKVSWKMVGFPGLPAVYSNLIEEYRNKRYVVEPQSIADFS